MTVMDQQDDEAKIKRQRQGCQPYGRIPDPQLSRVFALTRVLNRTHLTSGAVVKLW